jgi:hypothetical protein
MVYRILVDATRITAAQPRPHKHLLAVGLVDWEGGKRTRYTLSNVSQDGEVGHHGEALLAVVRKSFCPICFQPVLAITPARVEDELPLMPEEP